VLYVGVSAGVIVVITSCGGGGSPISDDKPNGTPTKTYNLTVTATMNTSTQDVSLKLIVQ